MDHSVFGGVERFVVEASRDVLVELAAIHQAERAEVLNAVAGLENNGLNQRHVAALPWLLEVPEVHGVL